MNWLKLDNIEQNYEAETLNVADLKRRVEPWLSALVQSEHLSLLLGSGFTLAIADMAGTKGLDMSSKGIFGDLQAKIVARATVTAKAMNRGEANLEDELRAAMELETGLLVLDDARAEKLQKAIETTLLEIVKGVLATEKGIRDCIEKDDEDSASVRLHLQLLLLSLASRPASRERLSIFTTNYDRLVEYACDMTGLWILDRFVGQLEAEFRSTRIDVDLHYNPPGIRGEPRYLEGVTRLTKLHGSIDWLRRGQRILRAPLAFGADLPPWKDVGESLMIFPNSAKDVETGSFPYAELFRDMSASVCRPNSTLVTYGYGFGDDHVNRVLRDMLSIPSTHLVILSFSDPGDRIHRFVDQVSRPSQVTVLVGPELASLKSLVENYLPRPAADLVLQRQTELTAKRGDPQIRIREGDEAAAEDVDPRGVAFE